MRLLRTGFFVLFFAAVSTLPGQSTVPAVTQTIATQSLVMAGPAVTLDLRNFIGVPGVAATAEIVQFVTYAGRVNVALRRDAAPRHVDNFLRYMQDYAYANTFFHRAATFGGSTAAILQGGGFRVVGESIGGIPSRAPVPLEYNLPNARGTLAAARTTDINSATSEWYFNIADNSTALNQNNGGGYTVFGQVLGTGLAVLDQLAALPRVNAGAPFTDLPVRNYSGGQVTPSQHLVVVSAITAVTLFPTGGGPSAIDLSVQNSAPSVVTTLLSGSTLTLTPLSGGTATIGVRAVDTNGNAVQTSFNVDVAAVAPAFIGHPASQTVAAGSTVVLRAPASAAAAYQWRRNGAEILGATNATLVIRSASDTDGGEYTNSASNIFGDVTSNRATLTIRSVPEAVAGRLANLSVLTSAGAGGRALTVGASIGPLDSTASLPVVVRAIGPTLALPPFGVADVLGDPEMTFHAAGVGQPIATNDNWGGGADLVAAFGAVGAFLLPEQSLDAAIARPAPGLTVGGYTVQVTGRGDAAGTVLAEMYDAAAAGRGATTPRLVNLSVLKQLEPGETMTAGFVIQGESSRTVLVRAVGPGLEPFGIEDRMVDPTLVLFGAQGRIAANDNWAGELHLGTLGVSVGAFPINSAFSRDAMIALMLPPGDYSAQVSDVNGGGGSVIVEVYEVR